MRKKNNQNCKRIILAILVALGIVSGLAGCKRLGPKETIHILSGSENKELEEILKECEKKTGVNIEMTYKGSVDIMHILKE